MASELDVTQNFVRLAQDFVAERLELERKARDAAARAASLAGGTTAEGAAALPFYASPLHGQIDKYLTASKLVEPQLKSATQAQYELLKAIGMTGPEAEKSFGAASGAAGSFGSLIKKTREAFFSGTDRYVQPVEKEGVDRAEAESIAANASAGEQAMAGLTSALKDARQMGKATFGEFAQGLGSTVSQYVLLGSTGPAALRKVTAQALASLSAEATVKALMALADGLVHLFTNPAQASADFTAAAIYGSIAGVAAVAGRAVAGDLFKQDASGAGAGGDSAASGSTGDRTIREGRTGGASDPYVIEQSRNRAPVQPIILHVEAHAVTRNDPGTLTEHVVNVVSNDPRVRVVTGQHVASELSSGMASHLNDAVTHSLMRSYHGNDTNLEYILENSNYRW
jgi:hypothetical protein